MRIERVLKAIAALWRDQADEPRRQFRDERGMNEDWQRGDLAYCVGAREGRVPFAGDSNGFRPLPGRTYRVTAVFDGFSLGGELRATALGLEGDDGQGGWQCTWFRKVRPETEAAELDRCALLRDCLQAPVEA